MAHLLMRKQRRKARQRSAAAAALEDRPKRGVLCFRKHQADLFAVRAACVPGTAFVMQRKVDATATNHSTEMFVSSSTVLVSMNLGRTALDMAFAQRACVNALQDGAWQYFD